MQCTEKEWDSVEKRIDSMSVELMELGCDSVQIITTSMGSDEGPICRKLARGQGQLYARFGAVTEWLREQKNRQFAYDTRQDNE